MTRRRIPDDEALADARRAGYTPLDPRHPGTQQRWPGHCDFCGSPVAPFYGNIRQGHRACRCLSTSAAPAGPVGRPRRTLEEVVAAFKAVNLVPSDAYPGSVSAKWRAECTVCGSEVNPRISSVLHKGTGCRRCGVSKALRTRAANKQ